MFRIDHTPKRRLGFNRYMVECECSLLYPAFDNVPRFNRYMVECEC